MMGMSNVGDRLRNVYAPGKEMFDIQPMRKRGQLENSDDVSGLVEAPSTPPSHHLIFIRKWVTAQVY